MAVTQSKTLKDLRQAVGRNLGKMITGTTTGGSTSTAIDTSLFGGDDEYIGSYMRFTSGNKSGTTQRISDYTSSSTTLTFKTTTSGAIDGDDTYELWSDGFDPVVVDELINQAICEVTGRVYDPVEKLDVHTDRINTRWEIPSGLAMIQDVYYRDKITQKLLHNCNSSFTATNEGGGTIRGADGSTTNFIDTEDYKTGSGANKFVITSASNDNGLMTDSITSVNLAKYDYIEFWIKSNQNTTAAGDLQLMLDNTAACASPLETLNIPILTADTWKYCRLALSNPETDTAIISVGLKLADSSQVNSGTATIWIDDIKAVKNDTAAWEKLARNTWRIDKEGTVQGASTADLVLSDRGRALAAYRLLKIVGGNVPTEFSLDTTVTEVPERYVVAYATALVAQAGSTRNDIDTDGMRTLAGFWHNKAEQARNSLPFLTNVRTVR